MSELTNNYSFKYKAFISYSHAADERLAPALQSALQQFAKPFYQLRAINIFRDKTTLQLTDKLWPDIHSALCSSEYFILMASPDAAQSIWVQHEIIEWLKLHNGSTRNLLIVLTDGKIKWDNSSNDFNWEMTTALPYILKDKFQEEPLYAHFEWAREAEDLSLRNPRFLEEVGRIGARLHNKPTDVMVGQDVRQHRIFKAVAAVVIVLLLFLTGVASATAIRAFSKQKEAEVAAEKEREARQFADEQRQIAEAKTEEARQSSQQAERSAIAEREAGQVAEKQRRAAVKQRQLAEMRTIEATNQRDMAQSGELAAYAKSQIQIDPGLSFQLAARAVKLSSTSQAIEALRESLTHSSLHVELRGHPFWVDRASFSPDGKWIVTSSLDGTAGVWEAGTGRLISTFQVRNVLGGMQSASFSPDSKRIVTEGRERVARVWEASTGQLITKLQGHNNYVSGASFSPDGQWIVTASLDATARVWEASTGRSIVTLQGHDSYVSNASFSPDGKWIVTASNDQTARIWEASTGRPIVTLRGHKAAVDNASFSPDGKWIVTASRDKTARVWEARTGRSIITLQDHDAAVVSASFSPDGKWIVTASDDETLRVWKAISDHTVAILPGHASPLTSASFSPDSQRHGYTISAPVAPSRYFKATMRLLKVLTSVLMGSGLLPPVRIRRRGYGKP